MMEGLRGGVVTSGASSSAVVVVPGVASSACCDSRTMPHGETQVLALTVERKQVEVKCVPVQLDLLHYPEDRGSSLEDKHEGEG